MSVYLDDGDVVLHLGDCREVMAAMDAESVDAIVCDPPYGLGFMGREWDTAAALASRPASADETDARFNNAYPRTGKGPTAVAFDGPAFQAWCEAWATEALRVLKPGGHLLAFGGTRTFHRLTCAIEDAGFEIRDCLSWLYGSGFPKSLDVSKAIDKAAGADRQNGRVLPEDAPVGHAFAGETYRHGGLARRVLHETFPATPEAAAWQGWGTALKPAWEPIVLARKPLGGTVAANVLRHGTGALNVDGCRIEGEGYAYPNGPGGNVNPTSIGLLADGSSSLRREGPVESHPAGRWPANLVLDEEAAARLDGEVGERPTSKGELRRNADGKRTAYGEFAGGESGQCYGDTGGPSRFFYTAKASTAERDGATHPTVKPLSLMRWCIRLVTPPGGVVLDPFAGSGTTLVAAREEGFRAVGIEREEEYAAMCSHRLRHLSLLGGTA